MYSSNFPKSFMPSMAMNKGKDNLLGISWHDSAWIPVLNPSNVLDYFSERSNPFYDRTCNNEIIKMQRLNPEQLNNMTGLEYMLLHVQEPILYVIRKQHRHAPTQVTPITDYYIIAGVVYQAPDIGSVVNSRLLSVVNHLQSAFDEVLSYNRYHPSKGYTWEFKDKEVANKQEKKKEKKEEPSSLFQRQRVDILLVELTKKFPLRAMQQMQAETSLANNAAIAAAAEDVKPDPAALAVKPESQTNNPGTPSSQDKPEAVTVNANSTSANPPTSNSLQSNPMRMKPPPEKRPRLS